jgi:penicillin-binding protein 2
VANWIGSDQKLPQGRLILISYVVVLETILLLIGFWKLQIVQSGHFADLAEKNQIRTIPIIAPRGKILDRYGRVIVDNYPSFSILLLRDETTRIQKDLPQITNGLGITAEDLKQQLTEARDEPKFQPIVVKPEASEADLAFVESHHADLPELELMMVQRRKYPPDDFLAHVIGYVGEVSPDQLEQSGDRYKPGDIVGKAGLEWQYNDTLTGTDGMRRVIVNSVGKPVRPLDDTEPIPGKPIQLTIDADLQHVAEQELSGTIGALVAMNPQNGEILAMASRPAFDPNDFSVRISRKEWVDLNDNPDKPLLNRAIQAQLAPGSVFKILESVAMLESGTPPPDFHVFCPGYAVFYGQVRHDWYFPRGHGDVSLHSAIVHSCDIFFYNVGERLGLDKISYYASSLGLGKKTGIDLPSEEPGLVPSEEWVERVYHHKWYPGSTISLAIGQGPIEATPIQLLRSISGIAMGGVFYQPHLRKDFSPVKVSRFPISENTVEQVTDGMYGVVNEDGGTGHELGYPILAQAKLQDVQFCGKTGTAQTISAQGLLRLAASERHHFGYDTWFVGFAPKRNPEIALAVLVQDTHLEAGGVAAPLAARFIKAYFEKKLGQPIQELEAKAPAPAKTGAQTQEAAATPAVRNQ